MNNQYDTKKKQLGLILFLKLIYPSKSPKNEFCFSFFWDTPRHPRVDPLLKPFPNPLLDKLITKKNKEI